MFDFLTRRAALAALVLGAVLVAPPALADDVGAGLGKSKGKPDAPVHIVEYASATCGGCKAFHETYKPVIDEFVAKGKVRFEMREFLRNDIDTAIGTLARCSGKDDDWHNIMNDVFANQKSLLDAAQQGTVKSALVQIGQRHGVANEAAFDQCFNDTNTRIDLAALQKAAVAAGVAATPTLIVNGAAKRVDAEIDTPEKFRAWLIQKVKEAKPAGKAKSASKAKLKKP